MNMTGNGLSVVNLFIAIFNQLSFNVIALVTPSEISIPHPTNSYILSILYQPNRIKMKLALIAALVS
jgi:hypothetical protein